jgi:hypothetical protein
MHGYRGSRCVLSQGARIRQAGLIGVEILPAHGHRGGGKDWCGLLSGLVLFILVVPPSSSARSGEAISSTGYLVP